jgi:ElaB/YqjD/DUF883 family membrane-anchored ribosome-binding protein
MEPTRGTLLTRHRTLTQLAQPKYKDAPMSNDIAATRTPFADTVATKAHAGADAAAAAADKLSIAAKKAAEQAVAAKDKLAGVIEENPLTSVVIAFGLGALACRLMRR